MLISECWDCASLYPSLISGVADLRDPFSQEALNAGLDGHEHRSATQGDVQ